MFDGRTLQDIIRETRNKLLLDSDFTQTPDSPLSVEDKALWASYRQELRDLPQVQSIDEMESADEVSWPAAPSSEEPEGE